MFNPVNIRKELLRERDGKAIQEELSEEVNALLASAAEDDAALLQRLRSGKAKGVLVEPFALSKEDLAAVFTADQIRTICVNYRLRFLDTRYFAGAYPQEVLGRIRSFEQRNAVEVKEFRIMAPARMFRLLDPDKDPLLFASVGEGRYYLVHQWGNDLAWYRKLLAWPLRCLGNLVITIVSFALLLSIFLPAGYFVSNAAPAYTVRMLFFLLCTLASFFLMINIGLRSNRSLSEVDWDNKYLY